MIRTFLIFLLATVYPISIWSQDRYRIEDSYQKESLLSARATMARGAEDRKICDKLGKEAMRDNRCFTFYPNEAMVWGKGFSDGLAKITVDEKAGFIDTRGVIVIKPRFNDAGSFSQGLAPFEDRTGKWGYIDKVGNIAIKPRFNWALGFREGLAAVQVGEKWGYIDRFGQIIIEPRFEEVRSFSEGLASVVWYDKTKATDKEPEGKWQSSFIDSGGIVKLSNSFDPVNRSFEVGIALVSSSVKCAYPACSETYAIDKDGNRLWTLNSWYISWFSDDAITIAAGKDNEGHDLYMALGRDGKQLFDKTFSQIGVFSDGLAPARKAWVGKYGFIDKRGEFIIDARFESARSFSDGFAAVVIGSRYGYVDKSGNLMISPQFEYAGQFQGGFALVAPTGKGKDTTGYIDRKGMYIWKPTK